MPCRYTRDMPIFRISQLKTDNRGDRGNPMMLGPQIERAVSQAGYCGYRMR